MCTPTKVCTKCGAEYDPEIGHHCPPQTQPIDVDMVGIPAEWNTLEEYRAYVRSIGSSAC